MYDVYMWMMIYSALRIKKHETLILNRRLNFSQ